MEVRLGTEAEPTGQSTKAEQESRVKPTELGASAEPEIRTGPTQSRKQPGLSRQNRSPPGWSRQDRSPPEWSRSSPRWYRRPPDLSRRPPHLSSRPPRRSRRNCKPWQGLGPREHWDTRDRQSEFGPKSQGREHKKFIINLSYSAFLGTQSALHSKGDISLSTTSVQHPPGWCDGSHSALERPPHTSLLVERRQSDDANQCMGMIRRPWWSEASGRIWPECRGNTPTLFRRTSWDF